MKKFFPVLFISVIFLSMLVSQMLINGQELSASRLDKNKERFSVYETQFVKLDDKTTKGKKISLKGIKKPIVIINFWASWCGPCVSEFKSLNALLEKHGDKVHVLGINNDTDKPLRAIKKTEAEYKLKFNSITDPNGKYADKFNVTKIPSSIVYHKGKVLTFADEEFDFMSKEFLSLIEDKI